MNPVPCSFPMHCQASGTSLPVPDVPGQPPRTPPARPGRIGVIRAKPDLVRAGGHGQRADRLDADAPPRRPRPYLGTQTAPAALVVRRRAPRPRRPPPAAAPGRGPRSSRSPPSCVAIPVSRSTGRNLGDRISRDPAQGTPERYEGELLNWPFTVHRGRREGRPGFASWNGPRFGRSAASLLYPGDLPGGRAEQFMSSVGRLPC